MTTVDGLRKALETKDAATATTLLADDVVFRSPAVHTPYEGKVATSVILHAVARVFEDFRYTRVVSAGDDHVLVFEARVGDLDVEGVDLLHLDAAGLVDDFRVMIRPLKALHAVVDAMGREIPTAMDELGLAQDG